MAEWTKEIPTEPGWYWWRRYDENLPEPVRVTAEDRGWFWRGEFVARDGSGQWWPVRIEEPAAPEDRQ